MSSRVELTFKILQELSLSTSSFCIIRGSEKLFKGDFRDIDCYICPTEYNIVSTIFENYNFYPVEGRKNEIFYKSDLYHDGLIFDLHFSLSIHGVNFLKIIDINQNIFYKDNIRFLNQDVVVEHAIGIGVYQNKFVLPSELKNRSLPNYEDLKYINVGKVKFNFWLLSFSSPLILKRFLFYIGLFTFDSRYRLVDWLCFVIQPKMKVSVLDLLTDSQIYPCVKELNLNLPNCMSVKLTKMGDLRFSWPDRQSSLITSFISQHTLRARAIVFLIKKINILPRPDIIINYEKTVLGFTRKLPRVFQACFFGTPSIDKSILINYKKGLYNYFSKSKPKNSLSIYDPYKEYEALRNFSIFQKTFKSPRGRLYKDNFITKGIIPNGKINNELIDKMLIDYTNQQYCKVKLLSANMFKFNDGCMFKVNKKAFEYYSSIEDNINYNINNDLKIIPVSWAHGDLTPWNIIFSKPHIYVIDFEKFKLSGVPVGYDFIHYYISKILFGTKKLNFKTLNYNIISIRNRWNLLNSNIATSKGLFSLNIYLVLLSYLKTATESKRELSQYDDLYSYTEAIIVILNEMG